MTSFDEDLPDVAMATHEVVQQAKDGGVWVYGGGLKGHEASVVATNGKLTDAALPQSTERLGGFTIVDVPSREEALEWGARIAVASAVHKGSGGYCPTRPSDRGRPPAEEPQRPSQADPYVTRPAAHPMA